MATITDDPASLFQPASRQAQNTSSIIVVLNQPILCKEAFRRCYGRAQWRLYADGGANRVRDIEDIEHNEFFPPHLILGDLDSLRVSTRMHYQQSSNHSVLVCRDEDQYSTDFGKAVRAVRALRRDFSAPSALADHALQKIPECESSIVNVREALPGFDDVNAACSNQDGVCNVIIFGGLGGRVDQGIGLLAELARENAANQDSLHFWLVSERSMSWVVNPSASLSKPLEASYSNSKRQTRHVIQLTPADVKHDMHAQLFSRNVGILPIFGPAHISTQGLEWDVEDWETSMTGQISTSNHVVSKKSIVELTTTAKVLFTVELGPSLLQQEPT
ncbi:MAG: hypothetical protein Q9162_000755 [Coniocarpon cinnabarinum]